MITLSETPLSRELFQKEYVVGKKHSISEDDLWSTAAPHIWQAEQFLGSPAFYPVYRHENYYSFSPIPLILRKGYLRINRKFVRECSRPGFVAYSGDETIDQEIRRVGGPISFLPDIESEGKLVSEVAKALCDDVRRIETLNPEHTNVIFCGGKDSLNLLLLPWRNPVLVVSGPPNDALVREFVKRNGLDFEVKSLSNEQDDDVVAAEIVANACFMSLEHCRWGTDIVRISRKLDAKSVAWLGQLGDTFLTPYWRDYYAFPPNFFNHVKQRVQKRLNWGKWFSQSSKAFARAMWSRGAMWQGVHLQQIRLLTGALALSAYHGSAMRSLLPRIDLKRAVTRDVRPMIGESLLGKPVCYPTANPGPPGIPYRQHLHHPNHFMAAFRTASPEKLFPERQVPPKTLSRSR